MRIESSRRLRGPNKYLARPVQVTRVLLEELTERESCDFEGFPERLLALLPGLADHHCAFGAPGGFVKRLHGGTYFGHTAEHVAIELSCRIGREVSFGRTEGTETPGVFDVVTECPVDEPIDSTVAEKLLELAIDLVLRVLHQSEVQFEEPLECLRERFEREKAGPSTAAIAEAARHRDIPVERIGELSLLRLGYGRHRRLVWAALTDQTSAIGVDIAGDKELTRQLLDEAGIPVPNGGAPPTLTAALELFEEVGAPVVVKPRAGRQGQHVFLGVDSPDALRAAFAAATAEGDDAVVEQQFAGRDYRVLTVGGQIIAAAERVAAHVVGDGSTDLAGLIARANEDPRRGVGHARALTRLTVDDVALTLLRRQGLAMRDVPAAGQIVRLRDNANLSTGGTSVDVTDRVHPSVADLCRRVSALVGLDIAGIDLRLPDITAELPPAGGPASAGVIEVNAAPGLRMHLGQHDVGGAIVDALYPAGTPSRIPIVAVTGTNGKTTVARLTAHLLAGAGLRVGVTTTDGIAIGGRLVQRADATGPRSARVVLSDPTVDAAVLETARGGLVRQGLGYDWSDVGIITNLSSDHLGQDGIETMDDLVDLKSLVAERVREGGTVVLNADDPRSRDLVFPGRETIWCSLDPRNPLVRRHWDSGGRAYLLADGWLVELADRRWVPLLAVHELGGGFGGAARHLVANALAAVAAARVLGVATARLAERLRTFTDNPGRGTLMRLGDLHVLVDYAHNPAAIAAMSDLVERVWGGEHAVAAITLPGDRRDDLLRESAGVVGERFGRVVLYEDADRRGRTPGEVPAILHEELLRVAPATACVRVRTVEEAIPAALALANPGDVVLLLYERIEPVLGLLAALGAHPAELHAGEIRQVEIMV